MIHINIDGALAASFDGFNDTLKLTLDNGVSILVTGPALESVRDALGGGNVDVSDMESAVGRMREALESAQSEIQSALESAQSSMSDVDSAIDNALNEVGCSGDAGNALDDLESALNDLTNN